MKDKEVYEKTLELFKGCCALCGSPYPQLHRLDKLSIHKSHKSWEEKTQMQRISVKVWCEYYNKTEEEFRKRYGRLPL